MNLCDNSAAGDIVRARALVVAWAREPASVERAGAVAYSMRDATAVTMAAGVVDAIVSARGEPTLVRSVVQSLDARTYASLRRALVYRGLSEQTFQGWFTPVSPAWTTVSDAERAAAHALGAVRDTDACEECFAEMQTLLSCALAEADTKEPSLDTVGLYCTP